MQTKNSEPRFLKVSDLTFINIDNIVQITFTSELDGEKLVSFVRVLYVDGTKWRYDEDSIGYKVLKLYFNNNSDKSYYDRIVKAEKMLVG